MLFLEIHDVFLILIKWFLECSNFVLSVISLLLSSILSFSIQGIYNTQHIAVILGSYRRLVAKQNQTTNEGRSSAVFSVLLKTTIIETVDSVDTVTSRNSVPAHLWEDAQEGNVSETNIFLCSCLYFGWCHAKFQSTVSGKVRSSTCRLWL